MLLAMMELQLEMLRMLRMRRITAGRSAGVCVACRRKAWSVPGAKRKLATPLIAGIGRILWTQSNICIDPYLVQEASLCKLP